MSARDTYPFPAAVADGRVNGGAHGKTECARALNEIDRLRAECAAWMNGVADAVEPYGYDRNAACGPSDLLPGLAALADAADERDAALADACQLADEVIQLSAQLHRIRKAVAS